MNDNEPNLSSVGGAEIPLEVEEVELPSSFMDPFREWNQLERENIQTFLEATHSLNDDHSDSNDMDPDGIIPYTEESLTRETYRFQSNLDIKKYLRERLNGTVVDIGSGGKPELDGVIPENNVTYLDRGKYDQNNFVQGDAQKLPFADDSLDGVYSSKLVHNEEELKDYLPEMLRVTRPGGKIILHPAAVGDPELFAKVIANLGIDLEDNCEVTLNRAKIKHVSKNFEFNRPEVYICIKVPLEE